MSPGSRRHKQHVREASAPIDFSPASTSSSSHYLGASPTGSASYGSYGSSPKLGSASTASEAKKAFAKIKYSNLYDLDDIEVGIVRDLRDEKRRSGVDAWSERLHSIVVDLSFEEFAKELETRKRDGLEEGNLQSKNHHFHRVKYFKRKGGGEDEGAGAGGEMLWEAQSPRRRGDRGSHGGHGAFSLSCSPPAALVRGLSGLSLPGGSPATPPAAASSVEAKFIHTEDVLPDEAWLLILQELGTRDLCAVCAVSKHLSALVHSCPYLWTKLYEKTFGVPPENEWSAKVVKHVLCKSERSALKWLGAEPDERSVGFQNTSVLAMGDSHVISGDGQNLRVWVHKTDRRIKTLKGHTANISCIGFDSTYVSSGDVTGHLKLWSMDELKNIRSLRAHHDTVSDTLHFSSLCITCSLDGFIKVWDATQAHPLILTLEGEGRLYNMCMHGACNRLYSVGADIKGWDLETAQACLQIQEEETMVTNPDDYYGYPVDVWPGTGNCSKALANNGNILASAGKGIINLYDIRTNARCSSWLVSDLKYANASTGDVTGLDVDDWKLVCGFKGDRSGVSVYDIRAAASGNMAASADPVLTLSPSLKLTSTNEYPTASAKKVLAFSVFDSFLVAGLEQDPCVLWNFDQSVTAAAGSDGEDRKQERQKKKKKTPRARNRKYPKRTTR